MPTIPIYPPRKPLSKDLSPAEFGSGLPQILHTSSGLAILEIQGTINFSTATATSTSASSGPLDGLPAENGNSLRPIGRLVFPDYDPASGEDETAWKKRVWLYVGRYQRLTGEVKKLARPVAVLRRSVRDDGPGGEGEGDALEVAEIVRWKIVFAQRPEPVGGGEGGEAAG